MFKWCSASTVVAVSVVSLLGVVSWVYLNGFSKDGKCYDAADQSGKLMRACQAYQQRPQTNGRFPVRLLHLIQPPEEMMPVLDGGKSAIVDPWGEEFKYAVVETKAGPVAYVWCDWEYKGKLQVIGVRGSANGKWEPFGWPD